jgi:hypothetical protein
MGWPLGGDWDRATTPPGASTADITVLLSALCRGVNERRQQVFKIDQNLSPPTPSVNCVSTALIPFYYTGDGTSGASSNYPTPANWDGNLYSPLVKNSLIAIRNSIDTVVDDGVSSGSRWMNGATPWTFTNLWTAASAGLTWDPDDLHSPDNYLILKNALDLLTVIRFKSKPGKVIGWTYYDMDGFGATTTLDNVSLSFEFSKMGGVVSAADLICDYYADDFSLGYSLTVWTGQFSLGTLTYSRSPWDHFNLPGLATDTVGISTEIQSFITAAANLTGGSNSGGGGGYTSNVFNSDSFFQVHLDFTRDISTILTDQT